jgi:hypothetical protein
MTTTSIRRAAAALAALGLAAGLAATPAAAAEPAPLTARTIVDRAEIQDLLTRYYYNLGHSGAEGFSAFYADGAELILGKSSYKGKEGIERAYSSVPADVPQRKAWSFNVLLSNPLVAVHGDTATAQVIFTEIVIDKEGDAPRILTQGREYDHLVKVGGRWKFSRRQITPGAQQPADWDG